VDVERQSKAALKKRGRVKIRGLMSDASVRELESLYRGRYTHFVRVATALLRDEEQASDAVHDAFVTAIRSRHAYRGEGPLEAWVWRIVVNAACKILAERAPPHASQPVELEDPLDPSPVRAAILALPERQKLVLFLRYYTDLDYGSIAAVLEISPGTVGATLNAAHSSLRRSLEEVRS
jgi:RNA polymerase sigma-70 factor (ECF subfamily)